MEQNKLKPTDGYNPKKEWNCRRRLCRHKEGGRVKTKDIPKAVRERMWLDEWIFGNAFCLKQDGTYKRINPMKVKLIPETGEWVLEE